MTWDEVAWYLAVGVLLFVLAYASGQLFAVWLMGGI